jgi:hypothetical protein
MPSRRRGYAGVRPSRTGCWGKTRRRTYSARVSGVSSTALAVSSNARALLRRLEGALIALEMTVDAEPD